jgi:putative endonuclease
MTDPRHAIGRAAERAVGSWLTARGWIVLAERWRATVGELDLIALDPSGALVAIEVKARRSRRSGSPLESVDRRRVARLRAALSAFLATRRSTGLAPTDLRVDVAAVERTEEGWTIRLERGIDGW